MSNIKHKALCKKFWDATALDFDKTVKAIDDWVTRKSALCHVMTATFKTDATLRGFIANEVNAYREEHDATIKVSSKSVYASTNKLVVETARYFDGVVKTVDAEIKAAKKKDAGARFNRQTSILGALRQVRNTIKDKKTVSKTVTQKAVKSTLATRKPKTKTEETLAEHMASIGPAAALQLCIDNIDACWESFDFGAKFNRELEDMKAALQEQAANEKAEA